MKQNIHHLYYLFYPRSWIIIVLLLFSTIAIAQESTPEEFHIGAKIGRDPQQVETTLNSYFECGFNGIWWEAYPDVQEWLDGRNLDLLAENGRSELDYIYHYATGYYSKWEAEQNQVDNHVGVKHKTGQGQIAEWKGAQCWSTENLSAPACSLIYGPHYRQEKRYKRWYVGEPDSARFNLHYNVRFRMALAKSSGELGSEDVCVIKVIYRYAEEYPSAPAQIFEATLSQKMLKVEDFLEGGEFDYISFDAPYIYPKKFRPPEIANKDYRYKLELSPPDTITYNDTEAGLGIQYWVDWLRTDDLCTLYVDNIEVYDNDGWDRYINPLTHNEVIQNIKDYAWNHQNEYDYLKYFYVHDEPYTLDAFIPYHSVEQIVMDTTSIPLITEFYPYWTHDGKINGEDFLQQWYDIGQPEKLMIDFYPFSPEYEFRFQDAEELRLRLQKCWELQPGFWYSAQAAGVLINGNWKVWRLPTSEEFNASVMLGLAHGINGIELFSYTSWDDVRGIVDNRYNEPFFKTHLWYHLKESLIPRLKGKLGNTLMNLEYTGDFLQLQHVFNQQNPNTITYDFHAGFFTHKIFPDNKYFFLTNLKATSSN